MAPIVGIDAIATEVIPGVRERGSCQQPASNLDASTPAIRKAPTP